MPSSLDIDQTARVLKHNICEIQDDITELEFDMVQVQNDILRIDGESAEIASRERFGIEDVLGRQNRLMNMQKLGLEISNPSHVFIDSSMDNATWSRLNVSTDEAQAHAFLECGSTTTAYRIGVTPDSAQVEINPASATTHVTMKYPKPPSGVYTLPLSVNGQFAASNGNISLNIVSDIYRFGVEDVESQENRHFYNNDFFFEIGGGNDSEINLWAGDPNGAFVNLTKSEGVDIGYSGLSSTVKLEISDWATLKRTGDAAVAKHYIPISVNNNFANSDGNIVVTTAFEAAPTGSIGVDLTGRGTLLTTGQKGFIRVPYTGVITEWSIVAEPITGGTCTLDVWKLNNAYPTIANSICAGNKPALSTGALIISTNLTGWNKTVVKGDIFGWNLDAVTLLTDLIFQITIQKSSS